MSDRCTVFLRCRRCDMPVFEKLGFEPEYGTSADSSVVRVEGEGMNYAAKSELEDIAKSGIPFFGSHVEGDTYAAGVFAAHDGRFAHVADVVPDLDEIASILEYHALLAKAKAEMLTAFPGA